MPRVRKTAPPAPATADKLIRDLREMGQRRGWRPSASGVDAEGRVTVVFELPPKEAEANVA